MSIYVNEPGRPLGIRSPESLRQRRIDEPGAIAPAHALHATAHTDETPTDSHIAEHAHSNAGGVGSYLEIASDGQSFPLTEYIPVKDIISLSPPRGIDLNSSLKDALTLMSRHDFHHLIVMQATAVMGLIDQTWLLNQRVRAADEGRYQEHTRITDHALPAFMTVSPENDARELAREMLAHNLNAALVVDRSGNLIGLVTSTDYLRLCASKSTKDIQA